MTAVLIALASYRLWRLVGQDDITAPWREKLPAGKLYDLTTCPWCLGSWITFAVTAVTAQVTSVALPVLVALAAATVVGLIGRLDA